MNSNIVDVQTLAQFWSVTPRTVQNYADPNKYNPPLPRELGKKNQYDFIKAMKWMYNMQKNKIENLQNDGDEKISKLKYDKQVMENKKAELELKKLFLQVVDKKSVLIAWTNLMNIIKNSDTSLKHDLKRDLNSNVEESKTIDILFRNKDNQLSKMQIERYIINEDQLLEEVI